MSTSLPAHPPHNRLGIDYRAVPPRKTALPGGIVDAHIHTHGVELTRAFLEAARAWGMGEFWTQTPLEDVDALREHFPGVFHFIAIPAWQKGSDNPDFINDWLRRLDAFRAKGARMFKLHMAPGTQQRWKMGFRHPHIQRVIEHAYGLGYHFMTHVGDPKAWFAPGGRYADAATFGTFESQFQPLEEMLEKYPDRVHLGAHFGGSLEDLDALGRRLDRFPNYFLDGSATKWVVRAIAEHVAAGRDIRGFILRYQDRILFGSDLVVTDKFSFDHYASRYWAHQKMWETAYRGPSAIEDPDAPPGGPVLAGLDLPPEVLVKLYRTNAQRWMKG